MLSIFRVAAPVRRSVRGSAAAGGFRPANATKVGAGTRIARESDPTTCWAKRGTGGRSSLATALRPTAFTGTLGETREDPSNWNVWLGMIVMLTLLWSLKAGVKPGLGFHMLGTPRFYAELQAATGLHRPVAESALASP